MHDLLFAPEFAWTSLRPALLALTDLYALTWNVYVFMHGRECKCMSMHSLKNQAYYNSEVKQRETNMQYTMDQKYNDHTVTTVIYMLQQELKRRHCLFARHQLKCSLVVVIPVICVQYNYSMVTVA